MNVSGFPELRAALERGDGLTWVGEWVREHPFEALAPHEWIELAGGFIANRDRSTARAIAAMLDESMPGDPRLAAELRRLSPWLAAEAVEASRPESVQRLALIDYRHPERRYASANIGDATQTLAMAGQVLRLPNVRLRVPSDDVDKALSEIAAGMEPVALDDAAAGELEVVTLDRDLSSALPPREGTWLLAYGWYMWPLIGDRFDFPFPPAVRPLFVSFHVSDHRMLTDAALSYLRENGPVGCRDLATVALLRARGVEAFFSGCITTTIGNVYSAGRPSPRSDSVGKSIYVDVDAGTDSGAVSLEQADYGIFERSFGGNLLEAWHRVGRLRDAARVITSRLHVYLPARSVGTDVEFRAIDADDPRFGGLIGTSEDEFSRMRRRLDDNLARTIGAIAIGSPEAEVRALWRELWHEELMRAQSAARG